MTVFQSAIESSKANPQQALDFIECGNGESQNELSQFDLIDQLIGQYRQAEQALIETKQFIENALSKGVMKYFTDGMELFHCDNIRWGLPTDLDAAIVALRIDYWARVLNQSEIFELMPASKRKLAREQFTGKECPPFDESTVRPTMQDLMSQRKNFFAERVDGIFRALSGDHVTNQPSGFSVKMIIGRVFDDNGYVSSYKSDIINDLRGVVGRLTGRGEPTDYGTRCMLSSIYRTSIGKKVAIDGGAFFIKVHKVGTAHFEVAKEVAIELNSILAHLYPTAIPSQFRTKPRNAKSVSFDLAMERLPMSVTDMFVKFERRGSLLSTNVYRANAHDIDKAMNVIENIGGTARLSADKSIMYAEFDYEAGDVLSQIALSGSIPETVTHQFYPTQGSIGETAARSLDVQPGNRCLEPSAGNGDLAQYLPKESTICIEIAQVRVKVLEAKGFTTVKADFLSWAEANQSERFDRILLNPPFSKGRAKAHLLAASALLHPNGRLVAVLPASMINTQPMTGFTHEWSEVYVDQFEGTAVRVVVLTAYPVK